MYITEQDRENIEEYQGRMNLKLRPKGWNMDIGYNKDAGYIIGIGPWKDVVPNEHIVDFNYHKIIDPNLLRLKESVERLLRELGITTIEYLYSKEEATELDKLKGPLYGEDGPLTSYGFYILDFSEITINQISKTMYPAISILHDTLRQKKEELFIANQKREQHIKDLCSQQQAISSLEYHIREVEGNLKTLEEQSRQKGNSDGCSLSPGLTDLKQAEIKKCQ